MVKCHCNGRQRARFTYGQYSLLEVFGFCHVMDFVIFRVSFEAKSTGENLNPILIYAYIYI